MQDGLNLFNIPVMSFRDLNENEKEMGFLEAIWTLKASWDT